MHCVNNGDIDNLVNLYHETALLIPTFSSRLLNNRESIHAYFKQLFQRKELSLALHHKTLIHQEIGDKTHSLSGIYCWRFDIDGELFNFEARFCYMLNFNSSQPIRLHHSSQIPRTL